MAQESGQQLCGWPPQRELVLGGEIGREVGDERGDLWRSLTQRGDGHLEDIEAVKEILAERPSADLGREIPVGGGDDLDIHRMLPARPDRHHHMMLKDMEEPGLEIDRHLPDLVEEHRSAVGGAEGAQGSACGAGEGPLLMAEKLALGE